VLTIGPDFEHRPHRFLGLWAVGDRATDDLDAVTLRGVADLHSWRGLAIQIGPAIELVGWERGRADDGRESPLLRRSGTNGL